MKCDVLIVGVVGQGILLMSNLIAEAALHSGFEVKKSETQGRLEPGSSVVTHVRIGTKVEGILIPKGQADILLASEPVEALRYMDYVKVGGKLIVSTQPITVPGYPDLQAVLSALKAHGAILVDTSELARRAGHPLTQSTVLVGVASKYLPMQEAVMRQTLKGIIPKKLEENLKAFELGRAFL